MKHYLKRNVKNVTVNKAQALVALIATNRIKQKVITSKTDNKKDHQQKSITILGDSMTKHVNAWEICGNCRETVKYM